MSGSKVISRILESEGINANKLAEIIDVKPTQVYDLKSGKIKKLSESFANKVLSKFSNYSKSWLMTGEGEMYAQANDEVKKTSLKGIVSDLDNQVVLSKEVFDVIRNLSESVLSQQRIIECDLREIKAILEKPSGPGEFATT